MNVLKRADRLELDNNSLLDQQIESVLANENSR